MSDLSLSPSAPQAVASIEPANLVHESRIPPVASKARYQPVKAHTATANAPLSFAVPTSIAFFKRLTWELTPLTRPGIDPTTATAIAAHIPTLTADAIHFALCLGVGSTGLTNAAKDKQPHLYVVFPHLRRPIDEKFWRLWHTEVIKPAFDETWISSGLVNVWEDKDFQWSTEKAAPTADEILDRFYNAPEYRRYRPRRIEWPTWNDPWEFSDPPSPDVLAKGLEGGFSDARARVYDEAWSAMRDMLKGGDEPREMSDPVLLAVWEKNVEVHEFVSHDSLVKSVGKEWDVHVDSRFVENDMFVVQVEEQDQQVVESDQEPESKGGTTRPNWTQRFLGVIQRTWPTG
jgi:hypothetical protein